MKLLKTYGRTSKAAEEAIVTLESRGAVNTAKVEPVVRRILDDVREQGESAVVRYATKFDGLAKGAPLLVSRDAMQSAWNGIDPKLQAAMQIAQANIRAFAEAQRASEWMISPAEGVTTGQIVRPLASVGCYVPGGRYPLPSTLLMTATPAQVAGVKRIVVCSPNPAPETLAAAWLAGIEEFYRIGGAQAIGAMAYGALNTSTGKSTAPESAGIHPVDKSAGIRPVDISAGIRPVDKIVGPGNLYVTAAKQLVSTICGIDMPAGPTEITVTSESGRPADIAADLVAQAEHDPEALAIFITSNSNLATETAAEVKRQAKANALAKQSLAAQGFIFVTASVVEARELTNRLAPEHLTVDTLADLKWIRNAGSVFVGRYAPQSMGDYISGPNHVLPTGRVGRIRGGLSVMDFVKVITVQQYTQKGLRHLGPHAANLADAEGLAGHAASVRMRMQ